jgi:hypothetical protein
MSPQQDFRTGVLTQLRSVGSDIAKPHGFDFYLYFPTEAAARQAGERLSKSDYRVQVRPAAKGDDWLCLASTTLTPETAPLADIGRLFDLLAKKFRGEFEGWEGEVIKE